MPCSFIKSLNFTAVIRKIPAPVYTIEATRRKIIRLPGCALDFCMTTARFFTTIHAERALCVYSSGDPLRSPCSPQKSHTPLWPFKVIEPHSQRNQAAHLLPAHQQFFAARADHRRKK